MLRFTAVDEDGGDVGHVECLMAGDEEEQSRRYYIFV